MIIKLPSGDEVLIHFGVKGMKWGVRKATTRGSTPPSKRKPKTEGASEHSQSLGMHSMSDAELRTAINRLKMQKEYAQLTAPPPKEKSRGRQLVENIVFSSAEAAGKKVLTGAMTNVLNNVLPPALREAPKKSKVDQIAEKVTKSLQGEKKSEGGEPPKGEAPKKKSDSGSSSSTPKPEGGPQLNTKGRGGRNRPPDSKTKFGGLHETANIKVPHAGKGDYSIIVPRTPVPSMSGRNERSNLTTRPAPRPPMSGRNRRSNVTTSPAPIPTISGENLPSNFGLRRRPRRKR